MSASATTATAIPGPAKNQAVSRALGRRRHRASLLVKVLSVAATIIALLLLASILVTLVWRGGSGLSLAVFTQMTRAPGSNGGLLNAIVGSLIQTVRFVSDILLSAPSILIGLFIYQLAVEPLGGFSAIAGSLALAVIVIPIVVRTTEDMLRLIPATLREAVISLGAPRWKMIVLVCYRAARQGIATGILLAIARVAGETAPLLFTSLGNLNWSVSLTKPMASLPLTIYQYAGSAFGDWVQLAWVGALLITVGVLAINISARALLRAGK